MALDGKKYLHQITTQSWMDGWMRWLIDWLIDIPVFIAALLCFQHDFICNCGSSLIHHSMSWVSTIASLGLLKQISLGHLHEKLSASSEIQTKRCNRNIFW